MHNEPVRTWSTGQFHCSKRGLAEIDLRRAILAHQHGYQHSDADAGSVRVAHVFLSSQSDRQHLDMKERTLRAAGPAVAAYLPGLADYHIEHAATCRRGGREAESAAATLDAAALLDRLPTRSADQLFELAVLRARLARAAGDRPVAATQVDAAQDALRRAITAGYRDATRVRHDPDLAVLRAYPGFQLLMMDLELPAKPFAEQE